MAKISIKSEKITPFGGIFHMRELFSRFAGPVIDKVLGLRCTSYGYQYSEIVASLSSVYFCGGDCVEDVTSHKACRRFGQVPTRECVMHLLILRFVLQQYYVVARLSAQCAGLRLPTVISACHCQGEHLLAQAQGRGIVY